MYESIYIYGLYANKRHFICISWTFFEKEKLVAKIIEYSFSRDYIFKLSLCDTPKPGNRYGLSFDGVSLAWFVALFWL